MRIALSEEQELLRETFAQLFAVESSPERVRAAEASGFDAALWGLLGETGALGVRAREAVGGGEGSLLDAIVIVSEAGRKLASGPLVEAIVTARLLAGCPDASVRELAEAAVAGRSVVTLALRDVGTAPVQLVPGGACADAAVALRGDALVLLRPRDASRAPLPNLGSAALARWDAEACDVTPLGAGSDAVARFQAAREEWKLLTAAALAGLAREALEIAGRYASERIQFGRPIGAFQGIAHPLADSVADVEAARLLVWHASWAIARGNPDAAALLSMAFACASDAATRAVARALHTHGGYGLSLEYDIQLYHRRGKAWALLAGDPQRELQEVAARLWCNAKVPLCDAGETPLEFGLGPEAEAFAEEARAFFEANLTDELRAGAHFAWEGHHPGFQRQLAEAGLLYPAFPSEYGGQDRGPYEMVALAEVFAEYGWTRFAISTTGTVATTLMKFASEELKREVLPVIARGDAIISLGYTEPSSGSDVAAAQTRSVRDGDEWVIDGQKMFTSGADLAQYVFLLTRSDPEASKHDGLTMFLVPLDLEGIEIQPVETLSDERTNLTFYNGVRLPDRYRVGEAGGGWAVVANALEDEHVTSFAFSQRRMLEGAVAWARNTPAGDGLQLDREIVRARLARAAIHTRAAALLEARAIYAAVEGVGDFAAGPMAKFYSTDRFIDDSADLMDLCAPDSLLQGPEGGYQQGAAAVEFAYRLSTATAIYAGTSEIMKSIVAQVSLGMPRSRS